MIAYTLRVFAIFVIIPWTMRIHRHRQRKPKYTAIPYRVNEKIKAETVLIVDENNERIGPLAVPEAVALAKERGFDLVEVSPKAEPPVCRFIDFGQFKYQKEKEARKQKAQSKEVEIKGVRLSVRIGDHDLDVRRQQAKKFLEKGNKIHIELRLRGREKAHKDMAEAVIQRFVELLKQDFPLKYEQTIQFQGGRMSAIIARV